jgi:tRNA(Ile)-lysidine synthase
VVRQTISECNMVAPHDRVLVAVSGGIDSVVLLHVLLQLAPELSVRLGVAHLNHGLRGKDADEDADFVAALARQQQLSFYQSKEDTRKYQKQHRMSLEEAARRLRYTFLEKVCADNGYQKVAVGHQADDNAEQVLMQLIRGAGLASLAGIPPTRDGKIIRPLIRITRQQINEYCRAAGLSYVTDKTNFDRRYLRNRIRSDLIPLLRKDYNPALIQSLNRLSEIVRDENRWTDDLTETQFRLAVTGMRSGQLRFSLSELRGCLPALQRRIIRRAVALVKGDLRQIGFNHIEAALQLIADHEAGGGIHLPGRVEVYADGGQLVVKKHDTDLRTASRKATGQCRFSYRIDPPSTTPVTIAVPEAGVRVVFTRVGDNHPADLRGAGQLQAFFDMEKLHFPLVVRNIRPGDRFLPLGAGGTQKVKKYFIDHKVPAKHRASCPLLVSEQQIIWVVGHRVAETAKVTASTARVLKAEVQLVKQ